VVLLRSWRFWATFLGYLVAAVAFVLAVPGKLEEEAVAGVLLAGGLGALLLRNQRPIAAGLGCAVVALVVVSLLVLVLAVGAMPAMYF